MPGAGDQRPDVLEQNLEGVLKKYFRKDDIKAAKVEINRLARLAQGERRSQLQQTEHPLGALLKQIKPGAEFEQFFANVKVGMGPRAKDQKGVVDFIMKQIIEPAIKENIPVMGHNLTSFDIPRLEWVLAQHGKHIPPQFYDLLIDLLPAAKLKYKDLSKQYQGVHGNFFLPGRGIQDFMRIKDKQYKEEHTVFSDIPDTVETFVDYFSELINPKSILTQREKIPIGTTFFAPRAYMGTGKDLPHSWRVKDPRYYGGRTVFQERGFYKFAGMKQIEGGFLFYFDTLRSETGKPETSVLFAKSAEEGMATIKGTLRAVEEKGKFLPGLPSISLEKLAPTFGVAAEEVPTAVYRGQTVSRISSSFQRAQESIAAFSQLMEVGRKEFGLSDLPEFPGMRYKGRGLSRRELARLKDPSLTLDELGYIKNTIRHMEMFYGPQMKQVEIALKQGEITPYEAEQWSKEYTRQFAKSEEGLFLKKESLRPYYERVNLGLPKKYRDELLSLANSKRVSSEDLTKITDALGKLEVKAITHEKGFIELTRQSVGSYLSQIMRHIRALDPDLADEKVYDRLLSTMEGILQEANLSPNVIKEFRDYIQREKVEFSGKGIEALSHRIAGAIDAGADIVKTTQTFQERQLQLDPTFIKDVLSPVSFKARQQQEIAQSLKIVKSKNPLGLSPLEFGALKAEIDAIPEYVSTIPWKYRSQFEYIESIARAYRSRNLGVSLTTIKHPGADFVQAIRFGIYDPKQFTEEYIRNAMGDKTPLLEKGFITMDVPLTVKGIVTSNDVERTVGFYKRNLVRDNPYLLSRMTQDEMISFTGALASSYVRAAPLMADALFEGNNDRAKQLIRKVTSKFFVPAGSLLEKQLPEIRAMEERLSAEGLYTFPISYAREFGFPKGKTALLDYISQFAVRVGSKPKVTGTTNVVRDIVDKLFEENPDLFGWVKPEHLTQVLSAYDIRSLYPFGYLIPKEEVAKPIWRQLLAGRYLPEVGKIIQEGGFREGISALPPLMTKARLEALKAGVSLNELYAPALIVPAVPGALGEKAREFNNLTKSLGNQLENVINYYEANKLGGVTHRTTENAAAYDMLAKLKFLRDTGGVGTVEGMQIMSENLARQMAHNVPHVVTTAVSPQRVLMTSEDVNVRAFIDRARRGELRYGDQVLVKPGQEIATILSETVTHAGEYARQIIKNESKTEAYLTALVGREGTLSFHLKYKYPGLRDLQKIIGQTYKGIPLIVPTEFFRGVEGHFPGLVRGGLRAGEAAPEFIFYSGSAQTALSAVMNRATNLAKRQGKLREFIDVLNKGARDKDERIWLEKNLFPDVPGHLQPVM